MKFNQGFSSPLILILGLAVAVIAAVYSLKIIGNGTLIGRTSASNSEQVNWSSKSPEINSSAKETSGLQGDHSSTAPKEKIASLNCGHFGISYPSDWVTLQNITTRPFPPSPPADSLTIVSFRRIDPHDQEMVPISIACYKLPPNTSLKNWVTTFYGGLDLTSAGQGDMDSDLSRAYRGELGIFSYDQKELDGMPASEIGGTLVPGTLSYAVFWIPDGSRVGYVSEIGLPLHSDPREAVPTDQQYANIFRKMVSSATTSP